MQSLQEHGGAGWRHKNRGKQEKQQLPSTIGDVAPVVAEPGLVRGDHHLQDVSCLVWPSSAQGSWSRLRPQQTAPTACEKGTPLQCCRNIELSLDLD